MKFLFVGTANRDRSRTAQEYFSRVFPLHDFDSCGSDLRRVQETREGFWPDAKCLSQSLLSWAYLIVCMEEIHQEAISRQFTLTYSDMTRVWYVPDIYSYNDSELLSRFESILWVGYHQPPHDYYLSNLAIKPSGRLGDRTK